MRFPGATHRNVYVRSQKAGERVLESLRNLYAKLKLDVNEAKTAVAPVFGRKFLGYCLRRWSGDTVKIAVAPAQGQEEGSTEACETTCVESEEACLDTCREAEDATACEDACTSSADACIEGCQP